MFWSIFIYNGLLKAQFLLVDLVLFADGQIGGPDHAFDEGRQDQGHYYVEGAEHYHYQTVFVRGTGWVVEGNHRPACLRKNLEHDKLGAYEIPEVGKLIIHAVGGGGCL